ncbi:hypothetical protein DSCA_15290 [Desulfosarcina alkanivorans]|uniref:Uncharacterized protein n=1 Tax=Desulfosarcina alkanivorans TaxID=571177 RepID=A0A5K7YI97_9BACT|nr:hypothetical protein DSCA_15290 [Desulfosarcina alkanivorans]
MLEGKRTGREAGGSDAVDRDSALDAVAVLAGTDIPFIRPNSAGQRLHRQVLQLPESLGSLFRQGFQGP